MIENRLFLTRRTRRFHIMKMRKSAVLFVVMALILFTAMSFAQTTKLKRVGLYTFCTIKGQASTWPATPSSTNHSWIR
jgi:DNA-binding transcriptional regulator of glucitol operon